MDILDYQKVVFNLGKYWEDRFAEVEETCRLLYLLNPSDSQAYEQWVELRKHGRGNEFACAKHGYPWSAKCRWAFRRHIGALARAEQAALVAELDREETERRRERDKPRLGIGARSIARLKKCAAKRVKLAESIK